MSDLPPLPEKLWRTLCTKCGHFGRAEKPVDAKNGKGFAPCLNSQCHYSAFVEEEAGHSDEAMQAYARAAVAMERKALRTENVGDLWDKFQAHLKANKQINLLGSVESYRSVFVAAIRSTP